MATKKNTKKAAKATTAKAAAAPDTEKPLGGEGTIGLVQGTKATKGKKKAAKALKAAADNSILAIHVNRTGRICFGRTAASRIAGLGHILMTAEGRTVRMIAKPTATEKTTEIRRANGRPYVSATRLLKPLGFDGTKPLDIEAAAYNSHGFEFKVA